MGKFTLATALEPTPKEQEIMNAIIPVIREILTERTDTNVKVEHVAMSIELPEIETLANLPVGSLQSRKSRLLGFLKEAFPDWIVKAPAPSAGDGPCFDFAPKLNG